MQDKISLTEVELKLKTHHFQLKLLLRKIALNYQHIAFKIIPLYPVNIGR